ncbi:single-stranded DNA-binding protein [Streptomyces sp. NPDC047880]|uniref:single-stranded DNA-binding protein n=1 Tax=Streptomyces TaxID=1883 RepID=UPI00076BEC60|nr:single-stranded DNA-binding protein [Streptomyces griseorubiginosus]KUM71539.1 single-stranded DNA-binding protein [Streptomyces griseorubiginosus]
MAGETVITFTGNVVADPELRFTPSGAPVANFRVANTPRTFQRDTNEWKDGDPVFLSVSVWRQQAENVAESIKRGDRVIIVGRLTQRQYEKDGERRSSYEIQADEVAPSLRSATAAVTKNSQNGAQNGQQYRQQGQSQGYGQQAGQQAYGAQQGDPWANGQSAAGQWGSAVNEPPF